MKNEFLPMNTKLFSKRINLKFWIPNAEAKIKFDMNKINAFVCKLIIVPVYTGHIN